MRNQAPEVSQVRDVRRAEPEVSVVRSPERCGGAEAVGETGRGIYKREGLAEVLKVSLSTVDRMLAEGEITPIRLRGRTVRFYLPDVVRQLTASALTRKRGRRAETGGR